LMKDCMNLIKSIMVKFKDILIAQLLLLRLLSGGGLKNETRWFWVICK